MLRRALAAAAACTLLCAPSRARAADPWVHGDDDALEEALADGDVDADDVAFARLPVRGGSADVHGQSWLSLEGFTRQLQSGRSDIGALLVVGVAFDRIALGKVHRIGDSAAPAQASSGEGPSSQSPVDEVPARVASIAPSLARACVQAALRASGLGVDDASVDQMASRARASAWLPEARMRAMRLLDDASHATTLATTDGTNTYEAVGANLVLELRLTWRLDRLIYAGDEPTLERARLERQQARARLAERTLEVLFGWRRAVLDAQASAAGSREELLAWLHASELEATLDVLTDGWFSQGVHSASPQANR